MMPSEIEESREEQRKKMVQCVICPACGNINAEAFHTASELHPGELRYAIEDGEDLCRPCRLRYPPALLKATCDYFDYALRLRTGETIFFCSATIQGDFVHLTLDGSICQHQGEPAPPYPFERGVDVRAADIVWCADAPFGS
jgi:hypothetical protein